MRRTTSLIQSFILLLVCSHVALGAPGVRPLQVEWVREFSCDDTPSSCAATLSGDGGCILSVEGDLIKLSAAGDEEWRKPCDTPGEFKCILPSGDSGLLAVFSEAAGAARLDLDARLVAEAHYGEGRFAQVLNAMQKDDGHFLLCGRLEDDAWLLEVDEELRPVWQKTYDRGEEEMAVAVAPCEGGGYVVVCNSGRYNKFGAGPSSLWVFRCDREGGKLSEYTTDGTIRYMGRRYIAPSTGGFVIPYTRAAFPESDTWLVRLDLDMNEVWQRRCGGAVLSAATSSVGPGWDGCCVVAGTQVAPGPAADGEATSRPGLGAPWVALVDGEGTVASESVVSLGEDCHAFFPFDLVVAPDGCFLTGMTLKARMPGPGETPEVAHVLVAIKLRRAAAPTPEAKR